MAYIGKAPVNGFHSKQTLSTDGSTVTFTLDFTVADETSMGEVITNLFIMRLQNTLLFLLQEHQLLRDNEYK
mgnify:CR=1 FL=1